MLASFHSIDGHALRVHRDAIDFVYGEGPKKSKTRLTIQITASVAWGILSAVICYPSVLASLSEGSGSLLKKMAAIVGACGVSFDWFSLTAYGGIVFIAHVARVTTPSEERLFKSFKSVWVKVVQVSLSIILGCLSRLESLPEAFMFQKDKVKAIVSAILSWIGEAGLPTLSVWTTIEGFLRKHYRKCPLEKIREKLVGITKTALYKGIRLDKDQRAEQFQNFYKHKVINRSVNLELNEIVSELFKVSNGIAQTRSCAKFRKGLRITFQTSTISILGYFLMDALLSATAVNYFSSKLVFIVLGIICSILPLAPLATKMCWESAGSLFDLVTDSRETYADEVFPILSKFLKGILFLCSLLQFAETNALAGKYTKKGSLNYSLLSYSNIVACSLLISKSFFDAVEALLQSQKKFLSKETLELAFLKEKTDKLVLLFQNMQTIDLASFLKNLEDEELKEYLMKGVLTQDDLLKFMTLEEEETQALLAQ